MNETGGFQPHNADLRHLLAQSPGQQIPNLRVTSGAHLTDPEEPQPMTKIARFNLEATDARSARREIRSRWPRFDINFTGYDEDGNDVFMSLVRKSGDKASVATARRNRSKPPVKFVAEVPVR